MPARWPWIERTFRFDFPASKFPDVLVRYRGTPARAEELTRGLPRNTLTWRDAPGSWSIQENIGHLIELEAVWERRLDDFLRGEARLSPADITNQSTHRANYNERELADVLAAFRTARTRMVQRLDALSESDWARTSVHPRLNQPMRLVDAIEFSCEHDDYHLARVAELARAVPK